MRRVLSIFLCVFLAACASSTTAPTAESVSHLFGDRLFAPSHERVTAEDVFALDSEMRQFIDTRLAEEVHVKGRKQGLFDALYDKNQLKLEYDATFTRNAAQAFAARTGNCLSLVIMTGALAKALGIEVIYHSVIGKESWSRVDDFTFAGGHVNLSLGRELLQIASPARNVAPELSYLMTIDFVAPEEMRTQRRRVIAEETVIAMFMNNRAAEAMTSGRLDDAYWWVRAAISEDPKFLAAYNTLGVLYRRHGNLQESERVLSHILQLEPSNIHAMSNLSLTLGQLGRTEEARTLAEKVRQMRAYPPFYFFDQGVVAMQQRDYKSARSLFSKEIDRDQYYPEFHAWLAAAYVALGDEREGRRHLTIAMEISPTRSEHDLYAARLQGIETSVQ